MAGSPPPTNSRALLAVKSKNNLDDLHLKRTLTLQEKEKALRLLLIDHEKLDLREFLKNIKICGSDNLPEAKFLLQTDLVKRLAGGGADGSGSPGEEGTGRRGVDVNDDDIDPGVFKTSSKANQHVHIDIYSKRNEYANLHWVEEYFAEEGYDLTKKAAEPSEACSYDVSPRPNLTCTDLTYDRDSLNGDTAKAKHKCADGPPAEEPVLTMREQVLKKLGITPRSTKDRTPQSTKVPRRRVRRRHGKHESPKTSRESYSRESKPKDPNDFMKDLLVKNSQKMDIRSKTSMEERLSDFYKKVKTLMDSEADLSNAELENNWKTITQDVKQVLLDSFAQEEAVVEGKA